MTAPILVSDDPCCVRMSFTSPVLTVEALEELLRAITSRQGKREPKPLVLTSDHPTIFLAGAHLGEIASLDVDSSIPYARLGRAVIDRIAGHGAATVAAVHGSCSGGGFDLVLACDVIVAGPSASFSHPGVRRGLVTGWGGTTVVPFALGGPGARRALLQGGRISAADAASAGLTRPVDGDPVVAAREMAARLGRVHPGRLELARAVRAGRPAHPCLRSRPEL
jgi:enoyl-CoA hydratase/carnithine racemase